MKRLLASVLALCLLLSLAACNKNPDPQETTGATTTAATEEPTTASTTEATTEATEETTEATEPPILYRSPLTGEPVEEPYTARPYTFTTNNVPQALPQCGVSNAAIVYETLVEGSATRCLAVYPDIAGLDHIGSIRSARTYFVDLSLGLDAIFIHHGYSDFALNMLREYDVDDLCPGRNRGANAFYRDQERRNSGYSLEHTSFADGDDLLAEMEDLGYELHREEEIDYGWTFVEDGTPAGGEKAEKIVLSFMKDGKTTTLTYNKETGTYEAAQYGKDYIDGNTDELVGFRNVLVIKAHSYIGSDGVHRFVEMNNTEGEGYFACGGKIIPIKWSRGEPTDPFVYTLEDGSPLELGVGTSYIALMRLDSLVEYE